MGDRVRELREAKDWSASDLAAACRKHGVSIDKSKVLHIERESFKGGVTAPTLVALALALDTSSDYLLSGKRPKP